MQRTRRRTLLTLGATALGTSVAGCLSGDDSPTDDDEETDERPTDNPDDGSDSVTVRDVTVLPEVVTRNSPDSYGVYGGQSSQYVVVEVAVDSPDEHPPESFAVEAGETYDATADVGDGEGFLADFDTAYGARDDGSSGWLAFSLPKPLEAETAALTWEGASHEFGEGPLERLRRPPASFDVRFETPEAVTPGETVTATVTAENVGDVDGTFVGALNRVGPDIDYIPEAAIVLNVASGEAETWEYTQETRGETYDRENPSMQLILRWNADSEAQGSMKREINAESE
jgi:hypothetical protein